MVLTVIRRQQCNFPNNLTKLHKMIFTVHPFLALFLRLHRENEVTFQFAMLLFKLLQMFTESLCAIASICA